MSTTAVPQIGEAPASSEVPAKPSIIKIEEGFMRISLPDGNTYTAGEVANPSYRNDKGEMAKIRFLRDPETGYILLDNQYFGAVKYSNRSLFPGSTRGEIQTVDLSDSDLVRLPHSAGYVTLGEISAVLGSNEFDAEQLDTQASVLYRETVARIEPVFEIARMLGDRYRYQQVDIEDRFARGCGGLSGSGSFYSPDVLVKYVAKAVEDELAPQLEERGILDFARVVGATGIMSASAEVRNRASVPYFQLWCRAQRVNLSDPSALQVALREYPYLNQLLDVYDDGRGAGIDFGDSLLVAASEAWKERAQEQATS